MDYGVVTQKKKKSSWCDRTPVVTHLLIEQSPEHRQWDVEHQNPQHHFNLLDQTFLLTHNHAD